MIVAVTGPCQPVTRFCVSSQKAGSRPVTARHFSSRDGGVHNAMLEIRKEAWETEGAAIHDIKLADFPAEVRGSLVSCARAGTV